MIEILDYHKKMLINPGGYIAGVDPIDNQNIIHIFNMSKLEGNIPGKVTFYEEPHIYKNELGQQYISVTTLIGKFKNKFDPHQQAIDSTSNPRSKYYGRDIEEVKAEWAKAGQDARERGTHFHKGKEDYHIKQALGQVPNHTPNAKMIIPLENTGVETDYTWLPDGEYSELILWNHKYKLAGIADKVIVDGDFFDIEDYKTNKSIDKESFFDRKTGKYKTLQWPLDHIKDCSYRVYELQLSIYAYLFAELSGKTPRNLTILHHPTVNGVITQQETRYPVEYKKYDLMLMFNMWGGYAPPQYNEELKERNNKQDRLPDGL